MPLIISRGGNLKGEDDALFNRPGRVQQALSLGFHVEVLVKFTAKRFYLASKEEDALVTYEFLQHPALWCRAYDDVTLVQLLRMRNVRAYALHGGVTSDGYIVGSNVGSTRFILDSTEDDDGGGSKTYTSRCGGVITNYPLSVQFQDDGPRVALLLVGQLRDFHIIFDDMLRKQVYPNDADVYAVLSSSSEVEKEKTKKKMEDSLKSKLKYLAFVEDNDVMRTNEDAAYDRLLKVFPRGDVDACRVRQWCKLAWAFNEARTLQNKKEVKPYTHLIKSRLDLYLARPLHIVEELTSAFETEERGKVVLGWEDVVNWGEYKPMSVYCMLVNRYGAYLWNETIVTRELGLSNDRCDQFISEMQMKRHLHSYGYRYQLVPGWLLWIDVSIMRVVDGPCGQFIPPWMRTFSLS